MKAPIRKFKIAEIADILDVPEDLLRRWQMGGVIEPDVKTRHKGGEEQWSLDNLAQIIFIDCLVESGIPLETAGSISQNYLKGCRVMEWDLLAETTYIWMNLEDPADFVMLPDYDFKDVDFVPDCEISYLIIPLKPIYRKVAGLVDTWSALNFTCGNARMSSIPPGSQAEEDSPDKPQVDIRYTPTAQ